MRKLFAILLAAVVLLTPVYAVQEPVLPETVVPGGHTLGVRLSADGLVVVGIAPVEVAAGITESPATDAGIAGGDVITHIDNKPVSTVAELQALLKELDGGKAVIISYLRDGRSFETTLTPVRTARDSQYRIGIWVRDHMAGIGTFTFYDPATGLFGALGHGINEGETGSLVPLGSGHVLYSEVESVRAGTPGTPGELKGTFKRDRHYGFLLKNTKIGLFGTLPNSEALGPGQRQPIPVAKAAEVKTGKAVILANTSGDTVEEYEIEITKLYGDENESRNFMLRVTDQRLLDLTGGIVQGMSGSPVIQDGKLCGAVTHVLISDPKRGYGVFAESMLREGMAALAAEAMAGV